MLRRLFQASWALALQATTDKPTDLEADWGKSFALPHLDVVCEHREYYPWINALSQNGIVRRMTLGALAGWEVLLRGLRNAASKSKEDGVDGEEEYGGTRGEDGAGKGPGDWGQRGECKGLTAEEEKARDEDRKSRLKKLKQVFYCQQQKESGREKE